MVRLRVLLLALICSFLLIGFFLVEACCAAQAPSPCLSSPFHIDFADMPADVRSDLANRGFAFQQQMADESAIHLSGESGRLNIATSAPALGIMAKKDLHLANPEIVEIVWGIERYPLGGDWRRGRKKEAVMVVLLFGDPLPGGRFYLPDMPLFLGMFLGGHEPPMQPFASENYPDTGRYVCMGNPPPGQPITTRLDIREAFRNWFDNRAIPPITGIAIEVDTGELPEEDASSSAFIHHIGLKKAD